MSLSGLSPGRTLSPPPPPPSTHVEVLEQLPAFPSGPAVTRIDRARSYLTLARARIEAHHQAGGAGVSTARLLAAAMDRLVAALWDELVAELDAPGGASADALRQAEREPGGGAHRQAQRELGQGALRQGQREPGEGALRPIQRERVGLALCALGSFGRRELSPHSDLDLLLLRSPRTREEDVRPLAQAFNTLLWDLKLQVGWSVRTPQECSRAAEEDHTIRTALLDCRQLAGSEETYALLADGTLRELLSHKADEFIADKTRELHGRRQKYGDTLFLLEPHLKQGDGGLRDLEAALWIAQARFRTRGLSGLLKQMVLPASEVAVLRAARDFLLRIRHQLHYLRRRKEDRLTFDLQEEVARFLGYQDGEDGLAVEKFMRDYYLSAQAIRRAADALIAKCEEAQRKGARTVLPERRLGPFKTFRGKLTLAGGAELFAQNPATILRLFRVADEENLGLYTWAKEQLGQSLGLLEAARGDPEVVEEFKRLLSRPGTRGEKLFELHETGVLGAVAPEFGRVTAHHQHDLYHVYTVDVHSLFAVRRLYALRAGDLVDQQPQLSREMRDLEDPLPLYLGMLMHDAGKGMGGNHSERGRELMHSLGTRLQLTPRQLEVAEFLVAQHLLMSHLAQRRDLSDPELIERFAEDVGDLEKLRALYLLTYADICSVGPQMWTDWKAALLEELYDKARAQLLGEGPRREGAIESAREEFELVWRRAFGERRAGQLAAAFPERYYLTTEPASATLHGRMLARTRQLPLVSFLRHRPEAGFSELSLCAKDRPGLLALLAGVLSAHKIDILRARITSTEDGIALDVFDVTAPFGKLLDRKRWRAARGDLFRVLSGETTAEEVLRRRRSTSLLNRPLPKVPAKVTVDNRASARFTVIDVRAQDRVGLLHAIASALKASGAEIALAKVATEAHRAVDSFYVTERGRKIHDPERVASLVTAIEAAIHALERTERPQVSG